MFPLARATHFGYRFFQPNELESEPVDCKQLFGQTILVESKPRPEAAKRGARAFASKDREGFLWRCGVSQHDLLKTRPCH